jgi:conjugal transfer pilus assembly protein TraA
MLNWANGYLGKPSPWQPSSWGRASARRAPRRHSALAGLVFALFMVYVPTTIESIMTATV